jgi:phosphatidylglycerol---prolipoprotein diacylglyceryl transferase
MITIDINPVAIDLGFYSIRWYGIAMVLAVIAILTISYFESKRLKIAEEHLYNLGVWAIVSGIVFARVFHIIDKWQYYMEHPGQLLNFEGLAVYGAVFGIILVIVIYSMVKKLSLWTVADMVSCGALVGMAIGRVGCLVNGCCYGLPTDLPWSVTYNNPNSYAVIGVPIHPTQIYHIIWNLAAFGLLWMVRKQLKPEGTLFLGYLAFYAAGDLLIRFLREGDPYMFGIQQAQLIGIIILMITVPLIIYRIRKYRKSENITK